MIPKLPSNDSNEKVPDPIRADDGGSGSGTPLHSARERRRSTIPPVIPDHEILRVIGRGAYGEVWLARNVMDAYRAVKVVYRDSFESDRPYEREFAGIQSFEPISRSHESQLDILHVGRNPAQQYIYYVMELADDAGRPDSLIPPFDHSSRPKGNGANQAAPPRVSPLDPERYVPRTLHRELKRRGRFSFVQTLELSLALATAIEHLHSHGLIHRDIKPANVIFVNGRPKLADIGLVTESGGALSFVGTEGYLPPEGPGSVQADIYSLGKTLYEVATGKDRLDFPELPTLVASSPEEKQFFELNEVLVKACHPNTQKRYITAGELHADLVLLQAGFSIRRAHALERRLGLLRKIAGGVALLALLAVGAYSYQQTQTREERRQKQISEDLATRIQMRYAENLLQRGEPDLALANLAQVLRRQPDNRVAAECIMAALTQRKFPRLATQPLVHANKLMMDVTLQPAHFSPDGQRIVTASDDNTVRIWDTQTAAEVIAPVQHSRSINSVEFSPDGLKVVSGSSDHTVQVMDARSGRLLFPAITNEGPVLAAMFDRTGRFIASASGSMARVYDADTGRLRTSLAHNQAVTSLAFSPDGECLATTARDGVRVWWNGRGELKQRLEEKSPSVMTRFSGDGRRLAAAVQIPGDTSSQVHVWDVESGRLLTKSLMRFVRIFSLEFSPDGQRIVSQTGGNWVQVWAADTGRVLVRLQHAALVYSACFSPDGRSILTASVDQTARLWDAATGKDLFEPMAHEGRVIHAEFSHDGRSVLTAGWEDKSVKIWDIGSSQFKTTTLQHNFQLASGEFNESGGEVILASGSGLFTANRIDSWSSGDQHYVVGWELAAARQKFVAILPKGSEAVAAQFTSSGPKVLVAKRNRERFSKQASLWDLTNGETVGEPIEHDDKIRCAHFAPDGLKLATGSMDGTARIWDARLGAPLMPPLVHTGTVMSVRFSPDSTMLVTTSDQGTALIWDARSGNCLAPPLRHEDEVWFAQFSPNGDKVVTVSRDYSARVWSTNGTFVAALRHGAAVEYAEFSPDGTKVATAAGDRTARLWNAGTGQPLTGPLEHRELVLTARFDPDGLRVITASMDGTAQVWDVSTGLKLGNPFQHGDVVMSASFSRDGHQAITASQDNTARIWEVPIAASPVPRWLPELAEAVGGKQLSLDGIPQVVSWNEYADLKARLTKLSGTDPYVQCIRPLTGDNGKNGVAREVRKR